MGDQAERDKVISILRACLLSAKGGISFSFLNSDYKKIIGENIPFRKFNYPTLHDFLSDIPGLLITRQGADWNVVARPTEDSAHIAALISRQKSSKKRSRGPVVKHRRPTAGLWKQPTPLQQAYATGSTRRSSYSSNRPSSSSSNRNPVPLMAIPQRKPIPSLFEKSPRYMVSKPETPQTSPSKRFSDRMANGSLNSSAQPGNSTTSHTPIVAYKNKAAVLQAAAQTAKMTNTSTPIPKLEPVLTQQKPLKTLGDRLTVKSQPPTVLSPLSPIQLINNAQNTSVLTPPQTPIKPVSWPPSPRIQDPCEELETLANTLNLPEPVYKIVTWTPKRQQTVYACSVKVGPNSYTSYPEEIATPEEAKRVVAAKTVKELRQKEAPLSGVSATTNKNLVKKRLAAIVADHQNGVFMHQIPTYYKEQYKENLPIDWEKIVEECSDIYKEKGAHDSTILSPGASRSEINESDKSIDMISPRTEKIQLNPIGPPVPGILQPPADDYWNVCISSVRSTTEIWARLIGDEYSGQLENVLTELEAHQKEFSCKSEPSGIEVGNYYVVKEDDAWHRVQCFKFDPNTGNAQVFFIDYGDDDSFHYTKLFPLEKRFCRVPAQAVKLCLAELEEFENCSQVIEYLEHVLLDESLIAHIVSREYEGDEVTASVVLYDTKDSVDVNLNETLLKMICEEILVPKLNKGQVSEVFVSHVTDHGDVYLYVKSDSMQHLVNLVNKLIQTGLTAEDVQRSEAKKISTGMVYFVRCFEDGNWYRGVVTSVGPNDMARVFLIDMGKTIIVEKRRHLLVLDQLSEVLAKYPPQVLKVRLHNIPNSMFNSEMAKKLTALAPPNEQLLAKVIVSPDSRSNPPLVELFKRFEPNNILFSINNTLAIDPDLIGSNGDGNNNNRSKKRLERSISRHSGTGDGEIMTKTLKPPKVPDFGKYFDVHVTMAANPTNFTVQPYEDRVSLEAMMVQLQESCMNYTGPCPSHESIKEGSLYAAKHSDGHFYRVCVLKIMGDQTVSVYLCDFGDVSVRTLDKLQPLGRQFLDLPYQAIRARLVGIQPLNIDWSVEDCVRFQELVVERNFVSIVVDSDPDRLSPGDTVLGLKLIDVSGPTDVYLDKLLIAEGRATAIDG